MALFHSLHVNCNRLLRNRVSAQQARERKKAYLNDLETKVKELEKNNSELQERLSTLQNENQMLRSVRIYIQHFNYLFHRLHVLMYSRINPNMCGVTYLLAFISCLVLKIVLKWSWHMIWSGWSEVFCNWRFVDHYWWGLALLINVGC